VHEKRPFGAFFHGFRFAQRLLARLLFTLAATQQSAQNTANDFSTYG
jgi:hypothetical protein